MGGKREDVRVIVGKAVEPIRRGGLLTNENIHHQAAAFTRKQAEFHWTRRTFPMAAATLSRVRRTDGQIGTRKLLIIVPLCSVKTATSP